MPEKSAGEIPKATRGLFDKGNAALNRKNYDYAIALYNQVLRQEPSFYDCRQALRATQREKAGAGKGFFKKMLGTASSSPLLAKAQLALRHDHDPVEAIGIAEQILNSDPNSVSANKLLAEAAREAGFPKTAVLSLEIAFKQAPKDKEIALKLGEALAQIGQPGRAVSIFTELQRANPSDMEIAQALKNFSARRTMSEGGYEKLADGKGSYRDILRDKDEALSLEQQNRQVKSEDVGDKLISEYEARIAKEPDNLKLYRSIAEIYSERKDYDRALDYYRQIRAKKGDSDSSLEQAILETTINRYNLELSKLDPNAPDCAANSERIKGERDAYRLSHTKQLAEKYPTDLQIRFELGKLYLESGQLTQAIQEFQKAQNNPHHRIAAMSQLGQCFARRNMNDLAARTFRNAIKEKVVADAEKMELIYLLGCVLEKLGKAEEAMEQFKQIYEVEIGYKDVAAKVDAYYEKLSQA